MLNYLLHHLHFILTDFRLFAQTPYYQGKTITIIQGRDPAARAICG